MEESVEVVVVKNNNNKRQSLYDYPWFKCELLNPTTVTVLLLLVVIAISLAGETVG